MAIRDAKFTILVDTAGVTRLFTRYSKTLPRAASMGNKKIAGHFAEKFLKHMRLSKIRRWTGRSESFISNQIQNPTKLEKRNWGVAIPLNLIALDRFKQQPHLVKLKKGRSITRWVRSQLAGRGGEQAADLEVLFKVRRHPFIKNAISEAKRGAKRIFEKEINKAIRRKGT